MPFTPISIRPFRRNGDLAVVMGGMLAACAVLALYWPSLQNGFVLDDWAILDVPNVVGLSDPALWRETLFRAPDDLSVLFRPLTMLTFLLQLWTWPAVPPAFHFVNLVIHAVNVFLLVLVASRFPAGSGRMPSLLLAVSCGLVYGVHPALTEPVIWISARADLLITFFLLFALVLDRDLPEQGSGRAVAVSVLFLAAMLCKESAVAFLLVLPLVHVAVLWLEPHESAPGLLATTWARHRRIYLALAAALAVYFAARFAVGGLVSGLENASHEVGTPSQHVLIVTASLAHHLGSTFWPFQGVVPMQFLQLPIDYLKVLPAAAAGAAMIAVANAAVCTQSAARVPALLFLAFIAALLPVSNIVLIPAVPEWDEIAVGARYLAFPLALACLAVLHAAYLGVTWLGKHTRHGTMLAGIVLSAWLLGSISDVRSTIPRWTNDLTLNTWAMELDGARSWRHATIGMYYQRILDNASARDSFAEALRMRDDRQATWIWNRLGMTESKLDRLPEAKQAFRRALELGTDEMRSRIFLAEVERKLGNPGVAADILEEGLRRAPHVDRARWKMAAMNYQLGLTYKALGRNDEAAKVFTVALDLTHNPEERKLVEDALRLTGPDR